MEPISEKELRIAIKHLIIAGKVRPPLAESCRFVSWVVDIDNQPSLQWVYETFMGLPRDHSLKKEFNPKEVKKGFENLELWSFDPLNPYSQLADYISNKF